MMKRSFVLVQKGTGELEGVISTHLDDMDDYDYDRRALIMVEVEADHPVFHEISRHFYFRDGEVTRKGLEQIEAEDVAEHTRRQPAKKPVAEF